MTSVERLPDPGDPLPFFVYGTLRPGEVNHDLFLRGRTASEEPAVLPDAALYDGPGYPYAVHRPGTVVVGELITAAPGGYGRLLAALDQLEEYGARAAGEHLRPDRPPGAAPGRHHGPRLGLSGGPVDRPRPVGVGHGDPRRRLVRARVTGGR